MLEAYASTIRQRWLEVNERVRRSGDVKDLPYVVEVKGREFKTSWRVESLEGTRTDVIGFRVQGPVADLL